MNTNSGQWLADFLKAKSSQDPALTLRKLSAEIGISPALLSMITRQSIPVSRRTAKKICASRRFTRREKQELWALVAHEEYEREASEMGPPHTTSHSAPTVLTHWYHLAILNLITLPNAPGNAEQIARRLGISGNEAGQALLRLERAGYIKKTGRKYQRCAANFLTSQDVPAPAIRNFHREILACAERALDEVSVELREVSSTVLPADPALMPQAKQLLRDFRRKLERLLEGGNSSRVYALSIQCFPLDVQRH